MSSACRRNLGDHALAVDAGVGGGDEHITDAVADGGRGTPTGGVKVAKVVKVELIGGQLVDRVPVAGGSPSHRTDCGWVYRQITLRDLLRTARESVKPREDMIWSISKMIPPSAYWAVP